MHLHAPTGYFIDDHLCWGDLGAGSILGRIYAVDFPDTSGFDDQAYAELENDFRLILAAVKHDERMQLIYYTGNEFFGPLDRYEQNTKQSKVEICARVRGELVSRFRQRMASEELIQGNVRLCVSTQMPRFLKEETGRKIRGFRDVFKVLKRSFDQREQFFDLLLSGYGGHVKALDNVGNYRELLKHWSPRQARQSLCDLSEDSWLRTIDDLCRFGGLSPRQEPDHGFYLDGYYFGVVVAKLMPRATWARTMEPFLALSIPNLRVVVNMQPLPIESEIRYEEERFTKLASNLDPQSPSLQSEVGLEKHRERARRLMSNKVIPYKAQLIVIACDRTVDGLEARLEAAKAAIGKTGAEAFEPSLATSVIACFNCATPGFGPWVRYHDFWHKMDDAINVANMCPAGSTPRGDLDQADWIADGDANNLVGGRLFVGLHPLHMLVIAETGAGKSVIVQTIVLQSAIGLKFLVVIDDGLSWLMTCHLLDPSSRPIVIRANGAETFNILDTRGCPRTAKHLISATALCHLLVGRSSDEDKDKLRVSLLEQAIKEVYAAAYRRWRKDHPEAHYRLCIKAATLLAFQKANRIEDFLEAFVEARAAQKTNPDALGAYEDGVEESAALGLDRDPKTEHLVRDLAFAGWTHEMFPTLWDLQDELHSWGMQKGPHQELCATLATLLRPWLRDGRYGVLLDGASNVDLGRAEMCESDPLKVVHFDLGQIGKSESELRAVAGFLIANEVRNHIEGMPRDLRKQLVLEEMMAFLKVPNGAEVVIDFWERMRKYSCQVLGVFQQYGTLLKAHPAVASAIIGNSSSLLLLRNDNRQDLDTLGSFIYVPETIKDQITRFPKPAELKGRDDAYAGFVYVRKEGVKSRFTVGRNLISREVEEITSSSGEDIEKKRKELREELRNARKDFQGNGAGRNGYEPPSGRLLDTQAAQ
jgi:TraG P-loop domain